ncbi:phosphoenolpyruvate carboxykinase (ATP) [Saccharicrinis aurantiacus]|uniref:hypothetical protein n=1 Tax=Saccharicrinis aurantiacus TaxID=1849719 RepID=UPI00094F6417|nr:hypothetical protein [Saccharicrinis aurantiacus]
MNDANLYVNISGINILISTKSKFIQLDLSCSISAYSKVFPNHAPDYHLNYHYSEDSYNLTSYQRVFSGNLTTEEFLKYKWHIFKNKESVVIKIDYENHPAIDEIVAVKNNNSNTVNAYVKGTFHNKLIVDPYSHPFGALLSLYLLHWNNGVLIHASCIINNDEAYAFTGISGIGKSTMARLWHQAGHTVINDDRLAIRNIGDHIKVYNTPMPYYTQKPIESTLTKIFILKQHPNNYIKPLSGVHAFTKVLSNFIQQFYEQGMIQNHLDIVESIINKIKVYEVGFKPDGEIVKLIKELDY